MVLMEVLATTAVMEVLLRWWCWRFMMAVMKVLTTMAVMEEMEKEAIDDGNLFWLLLLLSS